MAKEFPYIDIDWLKNRVNTGNIAEPFRFVLMGDMQGRGYVRFSSDDFDYLTIDSFIGESVDAEVKLIFSCQGGGLAKLASENHVIFYGESEQIGRFNPEVLERAIVAEAGRGKFAYGVIF